MTLGRIFDDHDTGLLLAICSGSDGRPAAFCQFVPAAGIDGYSLDLMRRDTDEHPNGLTDFVLVETIRHLRAQGNKGLGLNFATLRGVLAQERGHGIAQRVQRRLPSRLRAQSTPRNNFRLAVRGQERAILVGLDLKSRSRRAADYVPYGAEESLEELKALADTAGAIVDETPRR